ncbi:ComEA family DNA-binding protein [Oscillospiraceae bacterium LTW-04]|nr:helix-hairpin-helix domain-containing protein [Oscillospiraceae bacterium MB24-C1]
MVAEQQKRQKRWLFFILFYCLGLLLVLIIIMLWENRLFEHGVTTDVYAQLPSASEVYLVNLNHATTEELQELPKIGPVLAGEIIAYREAHGGFSEKEELLQVKGIGQVIYDTICNRVTI